MKDNCFTILCWFLPYINMDQPQVYICPFLLELPSHLPPRPTPLGCHRARGYKREAEDRFGMYRVESHVETDRDESDGATNQGTRADTRTWTFLWRKWSWFWPSDADFGCLASRTVREVFTVVGPQVCDDLSQPPQEAYTGWYSLQANVPLVLDWCLPSSSCLNLVLSTATRPTVREFWWGDQAGSSEV